MKQATVNEARDGRVGTTFWWSVLLVPLVYLISFGPVVALVEKSGNRGLRDRVGALYEPVGWLHDNTLLKTPLEDYYRLCGGGK